MGSGPLEFLFQIIRIVVSEDAEFRATKAGGIDDTGVDEFVGDDDVILAEQRADGPDGGGVAG